MLDLTNKVFGKLLVLKFVGIIKKKSYWQVVGSCSNHCVVRGPHLTSGHTVSCSCAQRIAASKAVKKTQAAMAAARRKRARGENRKNGR